MDPHPLANLFKRSNYVEPIASELSALDYLYEVQLEIRESENYDEEISETTLPDKEASSHWIMYFDGAFSLQGAGATMLLVAPTVECLVYVIQMHFP